MPAAWINGAFVDEQHASVSIRDTGLLHGAGVFTTMRAYGGKVFRLAQHLARLRESSAFLSIPVPYSDAQLVQVVAELLARNQRRDARLRLTATRGTGAEPVLFLTAVPLEPYPAAYYRTGMTVLLNERQKLNPYDIQAGHKTLNYLSRLDALREARAGGAGELLWPNVHDFIESGSISNVFIVQQGRVITPPTPREMEDADVRAVMPYPMSAVLPGITRGAVIQLARDVGIEVATTAITVTQLLAADEVFLSNSIMEIMPVCRIDRRTVGGGGEPGPLTRQLAALFRAAVQRETGAAVGLSGGDS